MRRDFIVASFLCYIASTGLIGQDVVIGKGSVFYKIFDENEQTIVVTIRFDSAYKLKKEDQYRHFSDHLRFVPGNSAMLACLPASILRRDTLDIATKTDFRTLNRYPGREIWYAPEPDLNGAEGYAGVNRWMDAKWKLSTVTVSARNRTAVGDSIPATWEMKFSPGFAFTREIVARDRIKGEKVLTTGIEIGVLANLTTADINVNTTRGDYELSRKALTVNTGALLNLSIGNFDLGVFAGVDFPTGSHATDWIYFWKPVWGFLFGIDLIAAKN